MEKTYSRALPDILSKEILPGILASSFQDPLDLDWVKQIVEFGIDLGLPMPDIYEQKRNNAINVRGLSVPSYDKLMQGSSKIKEKNPMDELFD